MGSKPKSVKVPEADYAKDISKFVSAYGGALPQVLQFEQQFRPQFQGLNLQDISGFLSGTGGQQGLFGLSRTAAQEAGGQIGAAREGELGTMTGQAPLTRGVMQALSPEQAAAVAASAQEAERARAAAQRITPQERREYEQIVREGFQSAGRLGGNLNIASEAMAREDVRAKRRAEATAAERNLYDLAGSFYTQPGLGLLSQAPLSYQTGQQLLGVGLGSIGRGTPGLINPDTGLNLGAAQRQNVLQAQAANAQAKATARSGLASGLGAAIGGIGGFFLGGPMGASAGASAGSSIGKQLG